VGSYRREKLGAKQPPEFFDPTNPDGSTQRLHMVPRAFFASFALCVRACVRACV
jgi:hypothetical protein